MRHRKAAATLAYSLSYFVLASSLSAQILEPLREDVQIEFKDGSVLSARLKYTYSEYYYSDDINRPYCRKEGTSYEYLWRQLRHNGIAKMEFFPLTAEERRRIGPGVDYLPTSVVKADVTFRDGTVKKKIYIILGNTKWESNNETGYLMSPLLKSITIK